MAAAAYLYRKKNEEKETSPFLAGIAAMQETQDVDVWPCNVQYVEFFARIGHGAWNVGMNGRTGIRYESLPFLFEMSCIPKKKWQKYYDAILVMESAALEAMYPAD